MRSGEADAPAARRAGKSETAFRTISEVADELEVPQHVLRFWEGRFPQIRPLKRAGGRRYYRPDDIALLRRIRDLLYAEGYTIKGVQKLLRDGTVVVRPAAAPDAPTEAFEAPEAAAVDDAPPAPPPPLPPAVPAQAVVPAAPADPGAVAPARFDPATRAGLLALLGELEDLRDALAGR